MSDMDLWHCPNPQCESDEPLFLRRIDGTLTCLSCHTEVQPPVRLMRNE